MTGDDRFGEDECEEETEEAADYAGGLYAGAAAGGPARGDCRAREAGVVPECRPQVEEGV